jgi:hypothetical protein
MALPSGSVLWYKADAGVFKDAGVTPCSNGDLVKQWNDQSGNHNHASNGGSDGSVLPVYRTAPAPTVGNSGLPLLDMSAANAVGMTTPLTLAAAPFTILAVFSGPAASGLHRAIDGAVTVWLIGPYNGHLANYQGGFVSQTSSPAVVVNTLYRTATTNNGTASSFAVDGTDYTEIPGYNTPPGQIMLGGQGESAQGLAGYFAELVVYTRILTPLELGAANTYLARWFTSSATRKMPPGLFFNRSVG